MFKVDYEYASIISVDDSAADGKFLDLFLKSLQENSVYKQLFILKEKWKPKFK